MGSSSKRSPEEIRAQDIKDQEEWARNHEVLNIKGGMHNTSRVSDVGANVETYTLKNGTRGFTGNDGTTYYLNEDNGRWESSTRAADYYNLGSIAAAAAPSGGGGGGGAPRRAPTSGVVGDVGAVATPGVTTEEVLGTQNYNSMNNFVPTSHTMGNDGQTQHLNPLVAAENWVHQLQPQPTYNLGQYINPGIGLLEDEQQNSIWGIV